MLYAKFAHSSNKNPVNQIENSETGFNLLYKIKIIIKVPELISCSKLPKYGIKQMDMQKIINLMAGQA